ncbi:MAG: hypothetical protein LBC55_02500 [Desulfovibrio sp.]|jgi:uncharacterized Zn finger protein/DNA-binding transcriptional regulator YiaG|nr:hypothetical protein [Desulfovibrio sp.]
MSWWYGRDYVSVEEKRRRAMRTIEKLRREQFDLKPVRIEGRLLSRTFWGKEWCRQMDMKADYDSRLPRGRSYVRNGAVCHLEIRQGEIHALVSGSELYTVTVRVEPLPRRHWKLIQEACKEKISTLVDLLQGKLSKEIMAVVCHPETGIFPKASEIAYACSCPDWAGLCKHTAATLYGVGSRLDEEPELLFLLRHVDPLELFSLDIAAETGGSEAAALQGVDLGDLFGIDFSDEGASAPDRRPNSGDDAIPGARQAARQAGRQPAKPTGKQAAQQPDRAAAKRAAKQAGKKTALQPDKQTAKQTGKQTALQPDRRTAKQTGKQTALQPERAAAKQTGKQTALQPDKQTAKQSGRAGARQAAAQASAPPPAQAPADSAPQQRAAKRKRATTVSAPAFPVLDIDKVTGADIAALREACGLSLSSFALRLDVVQATLERWEKTPAHIVMRQASRKKLLTLYKKLKRKFLLKK